MSNLQKTLGLLLLIVLCAQYSLASPQKPTTFLQISSSRQNLPLGLQPSLKTLVQLKEDSEDTDTTDDDSTSDDTTTDDDSDDDSDDDDDDEEEAADGDEATDVVFEDFDLILTSTLTEEEGELVVTWFDTYDVDDDEELSSDEFATGCAETFGYSEEQSDLFLIIGDGIMGHQYKDGELMIYEVKTLYNIYLNAPYYQQVEFVFFAADSDIDGNLTEEEFEIIQSAYSDEFDLDFDTVDTDGSGGISVDELLVAFGADTDEEDDDSSDSE